jgi:hypothetical protein
LNHFQRDFIEVLPTIQKLEFHPELLSTSILTCTIVSSMASYSHTNFRPYIINKGGIKLNKERGRVVKNKMHSVL